MNPSSFDPNPLVAKELQISLERVSAVTRLLAESATVPFIARYRKEVTGALNEVQIREIRDRCSYLLDLDKRRNSILSSIKEQGKLTPQLEGEILNCTTKASLEDLYLPYRKKRQTRAMIARERGLQPLADRICEQSIQGSPQREAERYIDVEKKLNDVEAVLKGAREIVAELISENARISARVRNSFAQQGIFVSKVKKKRNDSNNKYKHYFDYYEKVSTLAAHRYLAMRRGENEGELRTSIEVDTEKLLDFMARQMSLNKRSPFAEQLWLAITDAFKRLIAPRVEAEVRAELKERSDIHSVEVFADNLRNLLLAPPFGAKSVIGVDPGVRTGCKCVAISSTGKYLDTITIYPWKAEGDEELACSQLLHFVERYQPLAIAVGNGTFGRETEMLTRKMVKSHDLKVIVVTVNEAGASVYSASDSALKEFPKLDVSVRGAISIARRLQDPLAELVKIDPQAIGVGQYQHDVHQPLLTRKLSEVVESCVNHVGVDVNTASGALLTYVSGIGPVLAQKIVAHREQYGKFSSRKSLLDVSGLGPKAFEQCAGFLRIHSGENPLDASAVHPERYDLVENIARDMGIILDDLVGSAKLVDIIDIERYVGGPIGRLTLEDIMLELRKPGRDPRDRFEPPQFRDDVKTIEDLKEGMVLQAVITNVTAFGAFADIGVHRDGLIHISQLQNHFVSDPNQVVKVGDILRVRVLEVDVARQRISLSARF